MTDDKRDPDDPEPSRPAPAARRPLPPIEAQPEPPWPPGGMRTAPPRGTRQGRNGEAIIFRNEFKNSPQDAAEEISSSDGDRPLIDRFGNRHSAAVLTNWSPQALAALGVRRDGGGGNV